ncbi:response regulator [Pseudothauera nasutitermitis]|uniref:Response regulator n=1 Tax=Pseudothauera nasutitermitis TaxID=2565930 RepID=A0A4S4AYV0_9RHOO|nr:response regulator [Pseudothauera nasutitermitis]THF63812.1 response regulator [Pseudothauera nasutitermitis]
MRLLIVDDSNLIRTRIARVVESTGLEEIFIVGLARDGREALQIARETRPDVVTMDLTMPEMDGVATIRELMRMPHPPSILVVSALNDKSTAITALRLGARGFLNKPFTDDELGLALLDVCKPL